MHSKLVLMERTRPQPRSTTLDRYRCVVVVPTYNERENIDLLVEKIRQFADGLHILFVDDNSPDGTGQYAESMSVSEPDAISVLHKPDKEGLGRAYVVGFR